MLVYFSTDKNSRKDIRELMSLIILLYFKWIITIINCLPYANMVVINAYDGSKGRSSISVISASLLHQCGVLRLAMLRYVCCYDMLQLHTLLM